MNNETEVQALRLQVDEAVRDRDYDSLDRLWWKLRGWQVLPPLGHAQSAGAIQDMLRTIERAEAERRWRSA